MGEGNNSRLRPLMLAGTGSDVGKSVIATALCRIFLQDGYSPAPFKAQNMALNSYATPDGLEIGRAQAVQAEAAGIPCHSDMNPLLLKPQGNHTSQVILNGRPAGNRKASDYFRKEGREHLRGEVCAAFDRLASKYNPVVMEGAGSISELNLRESDLVNMPMALHAGAAVFLVGDIDRGGIFGSVYGSIALLTPEERRHIKGIIVNKFRGDSSLFEGGRKQLEEICGVPVLGVVPWFTDIRIDEEDSVALSGKATSAREGAINIAVVSLPHISNFTDFNPLERDPRARLYYASSPEDIDAADIVIIPGSKSTLADLDHIRRNGLAGAILRADARGATILGICGGYQMMGAEIRDPDHIEGEIALSPGLGLLPVSTTIRPEKRTLQTGFTLCGAGDAGGGARRFTMRGYEIHMGESRPVEGAPESPLALLEDGRSDGYMLSGRCMGTYLHGILDNAPFVDFLLAPHIHKAAGTVEGQGEKEKSREDASGGDYAGYKERQYDRLAELVRGCLDMEKIYTILKSEL